jgi:hypothetical protein
MMQFFAWSAPAHILIFLAKCKEEKERKRGLARITGGSYYRLLNRKRVEQQRHPAGDQKSKWKKSGKRGQARIIL